VTLLSKTQMAQNILAKFGLGTLYGCSSHVVYIISQLAHKAKYKVFPDWFGNNTQSWWQEGLQNWSNQGILFSGIWLDMNGALVISILHQVI
jgi:hypothetical protein